MPPEQVAAGGLGVKRERPGRAGPVPESVCPAVERAGEAGAKLCQQRDLPRARAERGAGKFGGGLLKVLTAFREKSVVRLCFGLVWVGFFGLLVFFFRTSSGLLNKL